MPNKQLNNSKISCLCFNRLNCSEERCQICQEAFGEGDIASVDCANACAQCKLCEGDALLLVPECEKYCLKGEAVCRSTCYKGKAVCAACALKMACMPYGFSLYYSIGKK